MVLLHQELHRELLGQLLATTALLLQHNALQHVREACKAILSLVQEFHDTEHASLDRALGWQI